MAFEVAIFTDVAQSDSVNHMDGFQFQSVSPGFTGSDMAVVQSELNFIPTPGWGAAHGGDETSHPEQWSYATRDGRRYLVKSRAQGLTNNGRPGNQLTETAVTDSLDDFVPYTPAQLLSSTAWTMARAPGSVREPWMTPLQIDPDMDGDALERFVTGDPWVTAALPAFVTMLQHALREDGRRVFIHHRDATEVLRWIAVGSLLLDPATVPELSFRVFHASPWNGDFKVVGVHPDLLAITPPTGWNSSPSAGWIDLEARRFQDTVPSVRAAAAVRWVVNRGIYDAMGAIQLAATFEPLLGEETAARAAEIVSYDEGSPAGPEEWRVVHATLSALAAHGHTELAESYETELLDVLVTHRPRAEDEFAVAGATVAALIDAGLSEIAAGIAGPTLEALAAAPQGTSAFASALATAHGSLAWTDTNAGAQAARGWSTALASAPVDDLPALFVATSRLGLRLEPSLLEPAAERLAARWASDPSLGAARASWYAGDLVERRVIDRVVAQLVAGDAPQLQALLRGAWAELGTARESALSPWARAADLAIRPPTERVQLLRASGISLPPESWRIVLGSTSLPLDAELWEVFLRSAGLPDDLARELETAFLTELTAPRLAEGEHGVTAWGLLFDALVALQTRTALPAKLDTAASRIPLARDALAQAHRELEAETSTTLRQSRAYARIWAMDDVAGTGRILANARDRSGAQLLGEALGPVARQCLDAHFDACAAQNAGKPAGAKALHAYESTAGPLHEHLGGAIRRLLALHRDVERGLKREGALAPLIAEIEERFESDVSRRRFDPAAWFAGPKKGNRS